MAKIVYTYYRKGLDSSISKRLAHVCDKLAPDNIVPNKPLIYESDFLAYAVMNPVDGFLTKNSSILFGTLYKESENWEIPFKQYPDGSYAIFRDNEKHIEILSDQLATRTIWYYKDDEKILVSTSQRALIMLLGDFQFDESVIPWMLSTGTLGPYFSWDERLKKLEPDSSVVVDKKNWSIKVNKNINDYESKVINFDRNANFKEILSNELTRVFSRLSIDFKKWVLPLSGGFDSRGILCFLLENARGKRDLQTITWGTKEAQHRKGSDGYIASKLTKELDVPNSYYSVDEPKVSAEVVLNRFLKLGEGRVDHISGYIDGLELWKDLFNKGIHGIIRGDEVLGHPRFYSESATLIALDFGLCSQFRNLKNYRKFGFKEQKLDKKYYKQSNESVLEWQDRLYKWYRLPIIQAALADLKLAYVEQINPLLSKDIMVLINSFPDNMRWDKKAFLKIVNELSPVSEIAKNNSLPSFIDVLSQREYKKIIITEMNSARSKEIFPESFIDELINDLEKEPINNHNKGEHSTKKRITKSLKSMLPGFIKEIIQKFHKPKVNPYRLAFRVFLIVKMHEILEQDANSLPLKFSNDVAKDQI